MMSLYDHESHYRGGCPICGRDQDILDRQHKAETILLLVGPLLDAWDGLPRDARGTLAEESGTLVKYLDLLRQVADDDRNGYDPQNAAEAWHQAVETASVLLGLPCGLSPREFLRAVQQSVSPSV